MAYSTAVSGFTFNSVAVTAIGNCTTSFNRSPLDITSIGMRNAYSISGVSHAAVELDVYYSKTDHSAISTQVLQNTADVPITVYFDGSTGSTDSLSGSGRCVGFDWHCPVGDLVRAKISIIFTGMVQINAVDSQPGPLEATPE